MLLVLVLFAISLLVVPNLGFAAKSSSALTPRTSNTLTGQAALYLGAGFIYLIALSQHAHIFVTVTAYTFAVMLVVLTYGYIRRAVWAITTSYALSTVFSIGLGEAMMVYENSGRNGLHLGNATIHAAWFLVPFAILTYVHLLVMRVRAEASVTYKVSLGVGGFALTALVYEITRFNIQNQSFVISPVAEFIANRNSNVATLWALGALVLVLRLSKAVRADAARNQVLNLSGLIALGLATIDAVSSIADGYNLIVLQLVLISITVLLLINGRSIAPRWHATAAFAAGGFTLLTAWQTIQWISRGLPNIGNNGTSNAPDFHLSYGQADVWVSFAAFFAVLGWFAVVSRTAAGQAISSAYKQITILIGSALSSISLINVSFVANAVVGLNGVDEARWLAPTWLHVLLASVSLAAVFGWRWVAHKAQTSNAVVGAGLIAWGVGVYNATSTSHTNIFATWGIILAVPAVLLLVDALIKRTTISAYLGASALFGSSWAFASAIVERDNSVAIWHLAFGLVAFAIGTLVLSRLKALNTAWMFVLPGSLVVSAGAAASVVAARNTQTDVNWLVFLAAAILALAASVWRGEKLGASGNLSLLASAGVAGFTGFNLILSAFNFSTIWGGRNVAVLVYLGVLTVSIFWHALAAKSRRTLAAATLVGLGASVALSGAVNNVWHWFEGPEAGSFAAAGTLAFAAFAYRKIGGEFKGTLLSWGAPTAFAFLPSVFYTFATNEISQPWNNLPTEGVTRLITLALVGTLVMLAGMRSGNRGLVWASVATLLLEFVPALWFGIENLFGHENAPLVGELRGLLVAVTVFVLQTILKRVVHIGINSIVIWGIPAVVSLAPTLIDVWAALGHGVDSTDWVRFIVLVSVSSGFLVIGAMRRLSGLFYPGFVGVLTAVLPYAFTAGGGLGMVFTLVALAGLIIWVAVRIDRFTGWLKELK